MLGNASTVASIVWPGLSKETFFSKTSASIQTAERSATSKSVIPGSTLEPTSIFLAIT